jgi:hypothetical protein
MCGVWSTGPRDGFEPRSIIARVHDVMAWHHNLLTNFTSVFGIVKNTPFSVEFAHRAIFHGDMTLFPVYTFANQPSSAPIYKNTINTAEHAAVATKISNGFATFVKATSPKHRAMKSVNTQSLFQLIPAYASTQSGAIDIPMPVAVLMTSMKQSIRASEL